MCFYQDDKNDTSKINSSTLWNFFVDASEGKLSAMEIEELRPDEMGKYISNDLISKT